MDESTSAPVAEEETPSDEGKVEGGLAEPEDNGEDEEHD